VIRQNRMSRVNASAGQLSRTGIQEATMKHPNRPKSFAVAALITLSLAAAGPSIARPASPGDADHTNDDPVQHEYTVKTLSLRGDTFVCGDLTLRVTHGWMTETNDADLRAGVARISTSRIARGVRLHGSDGRTYRASGVTAAWFVLRAPDFETPTHGLEISQVMFRGGPDKSPGWLRERIAWVDQHETETVKGPCTFGD
jgi:hypothetical protein